MSSTYAPAGMPLMNCTPSQLEIRSVVGMGRANSTTQTELTAYFRRGHDEEIQHRVSSIAGGSSGVVALIGQPKSGMKRALWEAIRSSKPGMLAPLLDGWWIWPGTSPSDPRSLLARIGELPARTVLWLPNAARYLLDHGPEVGEQVARELRDLVYDARRGPVMVLLTLSQGDIHRLTASSSGAQAALSVHARQLLAGNVISVPDRFTEAEVVTARNSEDPRIVEAAEHSSDGYVIQYLVEAPDFQARFSLAGPVARAILQCLIDARIIGHDPWVRAQLVRAGALGYLPEWERARLGESWFEEAIDQLTACGVGETGMLLVRSGDDSGETATERMFRLNDYLECQFVTEAGRHALPAPHLWSSLFSFAAPGSLIPLGRECRRRGLIREAARFFLLVRNGATSAARRELADMMRGCGRFDEALDLHRAAAGSHVPAAVLAGGQILLEAGRPEAAAEWLGQAIGPGDAESLKLEAIAYVEAGQRQKAVEVYRRLAKGGDVNAAVVAAEMIAEESGYEKGVSFLSVQRSATGLNTLAGIAELVVEHVDEGRAVEWLRDHAQSGDADAYLVGADLLLGLGEIEEALQWCDHAIKLEVAGARIHAARMYARAGLSDTALAHAREAARRGEPQALAEVAKVHVERGLRRRAMECYADAASCGHDESWVSAAEQAAVLAEMSTAADYYRRARRAGSPQAAARIAVALCRSGPPETVHEALRWYVGVVESAGPDSVLPVAQFLRGDAATVAIEAYSARHGADLGTAMKWLAEGFASAARKATAANASLQESVNTAKFLGDVTPREFGGAVYWFEQAACYGYPAARVQAAELLLEFDRTSEALVLLREVQSTGLLRRTDPRLLVALIREKHFDEALAMIESELDVGETALIGDVVSALLRVDRTKDAMRLLSRAVDAGNVSARVILADRQVRQNRCDKALDHYLVAYCRGRADVWEKVERILKGNGDSTTLGELRMYGVTVEGKPSLPWTLEDLAGDLTAVGGDGQDRYRD
ncbi:Sel1 domain-containing protein repeat-containing protein [Amycolatopsis vancoresmycina DSM 44592]|uniref:Sel1 domain-containing protein repeat-containing protein n=1 Tax=Amycolatopsis vancoresmycina DSM 44592 TaxID=1292037 RepID=R1I1L2_9PSEU|nr:Sel1 domain-containing protein repeat-containing protein [Amycolatopsis vancoresmycina DSM 44592]